MKKIAIIIYLQFCIKICCDSLDHKDNIDVLNEIHPCSLDFIASWGRKVEAQWVCLREIWLHLQTKFEKSCQVDYSGTSLLIENIVTNQEFLDSKIEVFIKMLQNDLLDLSKMIDKEVYSKAEEHILDLLRENSK